MTRVRRAAVAIVLAATAVLAAGAPATVAPAQRLPIEGYVESGSDASSLIAHATSAVTTIGVDGATLAKHGGALAPDATDADSRRTLHLAAEAAHARGGRAELLLSNYSSAIEDFSPAIGRRLLRSATHREHIARAIARLAHAEGFDGVQIDLESLTAGDRTGLVAFARALRTQVHERIGRTGTVSMAVMAETSSRAYSTHAYDVPKLSRVLDRMVLMTYDEHGPWSDPGSIGSLDWTRRSIVAFERAGAPRDRIDAGVAGYGYSWSPDGKHDEQLAAAVAARRAGSAARWSSATGEWSATLADGTVLHWSDTHSLEARLALATSLRLNGVAVWSLGQEPLTGPL